LTQVGSSATLPFVSASDTVRPELPREEYRDWLKLSRTLGHSGSSKGLWKFIRQLIEFARDNPSLFRKR